MENKQSGSEPKNCKLTILGWIDLQYRNLFKLPSKLGERRLFKNIWTGRYEWTKGTSKFDSDDTTNLKSDNAINIPVNLTNNVGNGIITNFTTKSSKEEENISPAFNINDNEGVKSNKSTKTPSKSVRNKTAKKVAKKSPKKTVKKVVKKAIKVKSKPKQKVYKSKKKKS